MFRNGYVIWSHIFKWMWLLIMLAQVIKKILHDSTSHQHRVMDNSYPRQLVPRVRVVLGTSCPDPQHPRCWSSSRIIKLTMLLLYQYLTQNGWHLLHRKPTFVFSNQPKTLNAYHFHFHANCSALTYSIESFLTLYDFGIPILHFHDSI